MKQLQLKNDKAMIFGKTFKGFSEVNTENARKITETLQKHSQEIKQIILRNLESSEEAHSQLETENYMYVVKSLEESRRKSFGLSEGSRGESLGFIYEAPEIVLQNIPKIGSSLTSYDEIGDINWDHGFDRSLFVISPKFSIGFECESANSLMKWPPEIFNPDGTTLSTPISYWKHWIEVRSLNNTSIKKAASKHHEQSIELLAELNRIEALDKNIRGISKVVGLPEPKLSTEDFQFSILTASHEDKKVWTSAYSRISDAGNVIVSSAANEEFLTWIQNLQDSSVSGGAKIYGIKNRNERSPLEQTNILWCTLEENISAVFSMFTSARDNILVMSGISFERDVGTNASVRGNFSMLNQLSDHKQDTPSVLACRAVANQIVKWI